MSTYRIDRPAAMATSGVLVLLAAVAAFLALVLGSIVAGVLAVAVLVLAAVIAWRPPTVVRLDETGFRSRRTRAAWTDVADVRLQDGDLVLTGTAEGVTHRVPLAAVGRRRGELVREVYDRMNTAHGYTRWSPQE